MEEEAMNEFDDAKDEGEEIERQAPLDFVRRAGELGVPERVAWLMDDNYENNNYEGDLYLPGRSTREIVEILRPRIKDIVKPHRAFLRVDRNSISVTIKGRNLYTSDPYTLHPDVAAMDAFIEAIARRYNFDKSDYQADYCHTNFNLHIYTENAFAAKDIASEAARLKEVYMIVDRATLDETRASLEYHEFRRHALALMDKEFPELPKKKPETNLAVSEEMDRWMAKVKGWYDDRVVYDTGPKYFRVYLPDGKRERPVCHVCRRTGTICKSAYRTAVPGSTRGTIFEAVNVFKPRGLIDKNAYYWLKRKNK